MDTRPTPAPSSSTVLAPKVGAGEPFIGSGLHRPSQRASSAVYLAFSISHQATLLLIRPTLSGPRERTTLSCGGRPSASSTLACRHALREHREEAGRGTGDDV